MSAQLPLGDFAKGHYRCILMDPPWSEHGGGKIKRGADRHYPLMKTQDIINTIRNADCWKPSDDCHLWIWATNNYLVDGLRVMDALGFRYVTNVVWVKFKDYSQDSAWDNVDGLLQIGLGQYTRGAHELLLFGVRGKAMVPEPPNRLPTVFFAERTKHSKKPEEQYHYAETISPGPCLEMFARERREGWDSWGNEV